MSDKFQTIHFNNDRLFSDHAHICAARQSTPHFADQFSSSLRGLNKNLNGLFRQYTPKEDPILTVADKELAKIKVRLNNRPRNRLGIKTPKEVFHLTYKGVAFRG